MVDKEVVFIKYNILHFNARLMNGLVDGPKILENNVSSVMYWVQNS